MIIKLKGGFVVVVSKQQTTLCSDLLLLQRDDERHFSLHCCWYRYRLVHEQKTIIRANWCSIDGNKDADKFNSEYKNNIPMKKSWQCVHAHAKQVWGNG